MLKQPLPGQLGCDPDGKKYGERDENQKERLALEDTLRPQLRENFFDFGEVQCQVVPQQQSTDQAEYSTDRVRECLKSFPHNRSANRYKIAIPENFHKRKMPCALVAPGWIRPAKSPLRSPWRSDLSVARFSPSKRLKLGLIGLIFPFRKKDGRTFYENHRSSGR